MEMEIHEVEETAGLSDEFLQASLVEEIDLVEEEDIEIQIYLVDSAAAEEGEVEDPSFLSDDESQSSSRPVLNLPAINTGTEEAMMKVARSEKPKKKAGEDKSVETLAKKLLEKVNDHDEGFLDIDEIADEEDEDPKRIYDLMNVFESLGILSKKGVKSYSREYHGKMRQTLENLKQRAIEVNLETQIRKSLKKTSVLMFSQMKENEEDGGNTKEFHLKLLTEKILMILLSSKSSNRSFTSNQILGLVFNKKMKGTEDSVKLKGVRVLKTLVGLEILSRVEMKVGKRRSEVFYQLQLNMDSAEAVEDEGKQDPDPTNHHDLLAVAMDMSLHQVEMEHVDPEQEVYLVDVTNLVLGENKQEEGQLQLPVENEVEIEMDQ